MTTPLNRIGVQLLAVVLVQIAFVATTWAQVLEEIIVVAQKREQNLQEIPISISVFSGDAVRELGWLSNEDVASHTPGLIGTSFSGDSTVSIFAIRGVGQNDFADHQEAPVAVYVDGAYVGFTGAAGIQMFDLERVEVLRGPQGTLFGRNATGGLMHLISKRPTQDFESYVDLTVGDFNQIRVEGAISGPFSDTVRGRLSILSDQADGYFENLSGPDMRDRDYLNVRAQLEFSPSETFDGLISVWSNQTNKIFGGTYDFRTSFMELGDMPTDWQGSPDATPEPNLGDLNPIGVNEKDALGTTITLNFKAQNFEVTSITDFGDFEKFFREDSDGNPSRTLEYEAGQDATQFSQELRLSGETEKMRWVTGLYYVNLDGDYFSDLNLPTFGGAAVNNYSLETKSSSLFGQLEYDLSDRATVTAGVRWIKDEKDYSLLSVCVLSDTLAPGESFLPGFPANDCALFTSGDPMNPLVVEAGLLSLSRDDSDYAGNLNFKFQANDNTLLYAGLSRGMKGGGYTAPLDGFLTPDEIVYEPEILTSFEVGLKSTFLDGKARLNATVFNYDYEGYQAFIFQGVTSQVRNQDADISGGEIELFVTPSEGLQLMFGLSVLDATVKDVELSPGVFADQQMITAPDLTVNFMLRKEWAIGTDAHFNIQVDGEYVDEQQYNTTNSNLTLGDDYTVLNARIGYGKSHGGNAWDVSLFAKNLTDEVYLTYAFDLAAFFGYSLLIHAPPRWVGAQFRYRWQ